MLAVGALLIVGTRAVRTIRGAETAQDHLLVLLRTRFEAVPLLSDEEGKLLRRSRNAVHVALAESLGVMPPATRTARDSMAAGLVPLTGWRSIVLAPATYSAPALTADAAAALDSVWVTFWKETLRARVPRARPTVTSVFRSAEDQAGLRTVNGNAAAGTSSHEYATTVDLAYRRSEAVPPPAPSVRWPRGTPAPLRRTAGAALAARWSEAVARVAADYPSRYDALLGRALIALEDRGVLVVVREQRQPVYHVTVARRLAGDTAP